MIRLGIPSKGRLQEKSFQIFGDIGLKIAKSGSSRAYQAKVSGLDNIEVQLLQASEIPAQLEAGELHLGVTGEDLIQEKLENWTETVQVARPLKFGRADMVVAVANCWIDVMDMADLDDVARDLRVRYNRPLRVATKYHRLTRQFFNRHGLQSYRIIDSQGATEGTVASNTADVIVDITSSGDTLRANNLKVLDDGLIMRSQACLCASRTADWSEENNTTFQTLKDRFEMRDMGRQYCLVLAQFTDIPDAVKQQYQDAQFMGNILNIRVLKADLHVTIEGLKSNGAIHIDVTPLDMLYRKITPPVSIMNDIV